MRRLLLPPPAITGGAIFTPLFSRAVAFGAVGAEFGLSGETILLVLIGFRGSRFLVSGVFAGTNAGDGANLTGVAVLFDVDVVSEPACHNH